VATLVSESYPADVVDKWSKMRSKFELDRSMPNPYKEVEDRKFSSHLFHSPCLLIPSSDLTIAKLQKELLDEAKDTLNSHQISVGQVPSSNISPGTFFQKAIEVEDRL
jgi:hypothetical protein